MGRTGTAQSLLVCEVAGAGGGGGPRTSVVPGSAHDGPADTSFAILDQGLEDKDALTAVGLAGAPKGAQLEVANGRIVLKLPPLTAPARFSVAVWCGAKTRLGSFDKLVPALPAPDLDALCRGGAARWAAPVSAQCKMGADEAPFAVDSIGLPTANPWNSWIRPTGFDFLPDGRVALCTFGEE